MDENNHITAKERYALPWIAIFSIIFSFGIVFLVCVFWTPVQIRYYASLFNSPDMREKVKGVGGLLTLGDKGKKELAEKLDGGEPAVKILAEGWGNVNQIYSDGSTPLFRAVAEGYEDVVGLLLAKGADINLVSRWVGGFND